MNIYLNSTYSDTLSTLLDKENRQKIMNDPHEYAQSLGIDVKGKEVVVVVCDKNTLYIPMPEITTEVPYAELNLIRAAGTANTAGDPSMLGCLLSCLSSAATYGNGGSAN